MSLPDLYDDPKYPCAYCVGWVEPDPLNPEKAYAIHADGRRVRRMYDDTHPRCLESILAYMRESE